MRLQIQQQCYSLLRFFIYAVEQLKPAFRMINFSIFWVMNCQFYIHIDSQMQKKIEEQSKTIDYIKTKYKQKTGQDIVMPKTWEQYLDLPQDDIPSAKLPPSKQQNKQPENFQLAIDQLSLPTRLSFSKPPLTSFAPSNKFHMIETISLNGFQDKGFQKSTLREFVSRIAEMRCLRTISLRKNGLGQQCAEEIQALLALKRITRVDLSQNSLGRNCLAIISKNFNHLQWVDLSRNDFLFEKIGLTALLNAFRVNGRIYHFQLDLQDEKLALQLIQYLKVKPQVHSFGPVDTKLSSQAMQPLCQILETKQSKKDTNRLVNLNLQFCYLERGPFQMLTKAISGNSSLVRLNLNNNHLGESCIKTFCKVLENSMNLVQVHLAGNLLEDQFGRSLAECLSRNQILQVVNISKNNIGSEGGSALLACLSEKNDTIQSFGDFETNRRIPQQTMQKIKKALRINRVSKEIRSQLLNQQAQLSTAEISNRQTEAFLQAEYQEYELLEPIFISNPLRDDPYRINIWNFDD